MRLWCGDLILHADYIDYGEFSLLFCKFLDFSHWKMVDYISSGQLMIDSSRNHVRYRLQEDLEGQVEPTMRDFMESMQDMMQNYMQDFIETEYFRALAEKVKGNMHDNIVIKQADEIDLILIAIEVAIRWN